MFEVRCFFYWEEVNRYVFTTREHWLACGVICVDGAEWFQTLLLVVKLQIRSLNLSLTLNFIQLMIYNIF